MSPCKGKDFLLVLDLSGKKWINLLPLQGARHLTYLTQGVALGYRDIGLSARPWRMLNEYTKLDTLTNKFW